MSQKALQLIVFVCLLFSAVGVNAQTFQVPTYEPDVVVTVEPEYPKPLDTVTILLESSAIDLSRSQITWSVQGAQTQSGIGITKIEVTAPGGGNKLSVTAAIRSFDSKSVTKQITIAPGSVDLV